jgi:hypothetical protein
MAFAAFRLLASACAVLASSTAHAVPEIAWAVNFTFRAAPNPLSSLPAGDFIEIGAGVDPGSTPDPVSSLQLEAIRSLSAPPRILPYSPETAPLEFAPAYFVNIPFAGAPTSSWLITASDSTGTSAPVSTGAIAHPQLLPFITDIAVSDSSTTPTVSWTTPDLTGFDVDESSIRVIETDSELHLYQFDLGPPTSTMSFTIPDGLLISGESYLYMVVLTDQESGRLENWSSSFSPVTRVPEPGALALLLFALSTSALGRSRPPPRRTRGR